MQPLLDERGYDLKKWSRDLKKEKLHLLPGKAPTLFNNGAKTHLEFPIFQWLFSRIFLPMEHLMFCFVFFCLYLQAYRWCWVTWCVGLRTRWSRFGILFSTQTCCLPYCIVFLRCLPKRRPLWSPSSSSSQIIDTKWRFSSWWCVAKTISLSAPTQEKEIDQNR